MAAPLCPCFLGGLLLTFQSYSWNWAQNVPGGMNRLQTDFRRKQQLYSRWSYFYIHQNNTNTAPRQEAHTHADPRTLERQQGEGAVLRCPPLRKLCVHRSPRWDHCPSLLNIASRALGWMLLQEEVRAGTEAEECRMRKLSCFPEQLERDLRPHLSGSLLQVPVLPFVFTLLGP